MLVGVLAFGASFIGSIYGVSTDHTQVAAASGTIGALVFLSAAIVGAIFSIKFLLAPFLVFKETLANTAAFRRSNELIKGMWWRVWFRQAQFSFVFGIASSIVIAILSAMTNGFGSTAGPILKSLLGTLVWMLVLPLEFLLLSQIYQNLRRIKG